MINEIRAALLCAALGAFFQSPARLVWSDEGRPRGAEGLAFALSGDAARMEGRISEIHYVPPRFWARLKTRGGQILVAGALDGLSAADQERFRICCLKQGSYVLLDVTLIPGRVPEVNALRTSEGGK